MKRKTVVLVVVIGVMMVVIILALVALYLMTQESRIAEHKIKRMRAFYAAQAGNIDAFEQLRKGFINPTVGDPTTYNLPEKVNGYTVTVTVAARGDAEHGCPPSAPSEFCINAHVQY